MRPCFYSRQQGNCSRTRTPASGACASENGLWAPSALQELQENLAGLGLSPKEAQA